MLQIIYATAFLVKRLKKSFTLHVRLFNCLTRIVLVWSAVDRGIEPRSNHSKDYQFVFVASSLSTGH